MGPGNNYYRLVYDRKLFRILTTDACDIINNNDKPIVGRWSLAIIEPDNNRHPINIKY